MRFGMYIDMRNPPEWRRPWAEHYARWLDRIAEAERLGADTVWLTEHHFFDDGYLPQCWTFAAAIAARTRAIRIGTAVALLPLHSALETAEQIAITDIISNGRIEPGFGVGYRKPEYVAFEGDYKHRYRVFAERIHALRQLWGEQPGAERLATPGPIQNPMPLWGGFGGPMGARTAGRLGLGLQSINKDVVDDYRFGLQQGGHDPSMARMSGQPFEFLLADDPERAWAAVKQHAAYRWNSYNRYMFEGTSRPPSPLTTGDDWVETGRFHVGTPDEIASAIKGVAGDLPVTDMYSWADFPGTPDELVERHIELTFTKLAPLLR